MSGPPDPLQKGRNRTRRAELADEIDIADVDPKLEGGGRHQGLQFSALQPLLGGEPELLSHAAVMGGDVALAEAVGELAGDAFGHAPGVDEHQGRAVLLDQVGQAGVDLRPDLARHHRFERRSRHFDAQIARALMAGVDGRNVRGRRAVRGGARKEMRNNVDRLLRRGQADALQPIAAKRRQPLQGQRKVGAALVWRDGVNFVDDHRPGGRQHAAPGFRAE